ncbi:hypothetical protein pclt_cds_1194 [Pandoravirus celtis]|uniref:Uncharacterized protein n=1 Tax=Pandoravirus celtis TaxID=2568002 RepID=A0A4D6EIV9_9VIRU|nr:hypothetical protein pclt_cds_1194 [Pandoravirus celtis]
MSRRCLGVAHLQARPCPWPLSPDPTQCAVDPVFGALPSLTLEEVFWYHLRNEVLGDAASKDEDEDDARDLADLRAWLASYKPLRGSPEFCRAARRLLAAWSQPHATTAPTLAGVASCHRHHMALVRSPMCGVGVDRARRPPPCASLACWQSVSSTSCARCTIRRPRLSTKCLARLASLRPGCPRRSAFA